MTKQTIQEEMYKFISLWSVDRLSAFLKDIIPLFELYDIDEKEDWVKQELGEEDYHAARIVRTIYLVSRIAENHSGILARIKAEHKHLWKRLEIEAGKGTIKVDNT